MVANNESLTMSSEQVAELLELRHDNVRQAANNLRSNGVISFTEISVKGSGRPKQVMQFDKRNSIVIAAKLNDVFMGRIIDRWIELENKQQEVKLPNPKQLALMVIKSEEEKEMALIEVDRLQGVCQTITAQFAKGVTASKFCKMLNGVNTQQVTNTLIEMGKLRQSKSGVVPVAYTRDNYFIEKQEEHNGKLRSHTELTIRGAKWLYRAYLSNKLPMKVSWDGNFNHLVFK